MKKAFAYVRVSGKGQVKGDGFPRQLAAINQHAEDNHVRIVRVFREKGVTGTKDLENRPAFVEMMEALHGNGVKLVLVESLGRLARDLMVQESILHDLKRNGFDLISTLEPDLCSDEPSRKVMRQVMGAFHEYEKSMLVLKLRGARQRKRAKTGRCEGRKPYGYHEGEKVVIRRMEALRALGMGFDRIAAQLNTEGIKPRKGERWHGLVVNRILTGKGRVAQRNQS